MKVILSLLVVFIVLVVSIMVGAQNNQIVTLNYLIAQADLKLSTLMVLMVLIGMLLSIIVFSFVWLKLRWQITRLKKQQQPQA